MNLLSRLLGKSTVQPTTRAPAELPAPWNILYKTGNGIGGAPASLRSIPELDDNDFEEIFDSLVDDFWHQGTIYVADTGRGEVLAFGPGGAQAHRFRPHDRKNFRPVGVAVQESRLYVADIVSHAIEVFDTTSGEHLRSIGAAGSAPGQFYYPTGLAFDNEARLVVADLMNARVQVITTDGESVLSFGRPGDRYGDMGKPKRVAVGPDGVILVADPEFAHVHLFDHQGRLLMLIGGPGNDAGSTPLPAGVAVAQTLPPRLTDSLARSPLPRHQRPWNFSWMQARPRNLQNRKHREGQLVLKPLL